MDTQFIQMRRQKFREDERQSYLQDFMKEKRQIISNEIDRAQFQNLIENFGAQRNDSLLLVDNAELIEVQHLNEQKLIQKLFKLDNFYNWDVIQILIQIILNRELFLYMQNREHLLEELSQILKKLAFSLDKDEVHEFWRLIKIITFQEPSELIQKKIIKILIQTIINSRDIYQIQLDIFERILQKNKSKQNVLIIEFPPNCKKFNELLYILKLKLQQKDNNMNNKILNIFNLLIKINKNHAQIIYTEQLIELLIHYVLEYPKELASTSFKLIHRLYNQFYEEKFLKYKFKSLLNKMLSSQDMYLIIKALKFLITENYYFEDLHEYLELLKIQQMDFNNTEILHLIEVNESIMNDHYNINNNY